ncbi:MAG: alpha/beta hydrolase [Bacteroidia bacterium]|nr:alpha/beta hydrolase [Bacteroidia bacterium]
MSIRSTLFNFVIRNGHFFRGKLRKEIFDFNTSIPAFRDRCEKGAKRFGGPAKGVIIQARTIQEIRAEWLIPQHSPAEKVILYFHGGGYVSGSCADHRGIVSKFAKYCGVPVLLFDYRLAPENPYPAAMEDALSLYAWLLSNGYPAGNILFAGESAGGGLCLATLLALKQNNQPLPVAAVAISPWTDLTCSSDSYKTKGRVSPAPTESWTVFSSHYIGENDARNPFISPLFGDLHGLPPILINAAVDDELFEDAEKFSRKAKDAGVDVQFTAGEGMIHCYPLLAPMFPEATEAMSEIVAYIRTQLQLK